MIDDGLFKRFPKPDVVLGQHVMVGPAGAVAGRTGAITSAADSLQIRLFGRGAHGSMPQASIDPVVMAAATVMRLQTVVSREVAAAEAAVVTVGALQAGTKENVIPDEAIIKLNVRTFDAGVRKRVLAAIERIVNAEAAASGAPRPPEITQLDRYPLNVNDAEASQRVADAFRRHFSEERVRQMEQIVLRINQFLGYDFNTVELAIRDGIPYAIDFCNPAPDAERESVGEDNFNWVVETSAAYAIERALDTREGLDNLTWGEYLKKSTLQKPLMG